MSFSNYLEDKVLDHVFKGLAFTQPVNLYISLHSADPGETGMNELSGNGYARQGHDVWNVSSGGTKTNNGPCIFSVASGTWLQITHFGIWDSSIAGNFFGGGSVITPKIIERGEVVEFSTGQLLITLD